MLSVLTKSIHLIDYQNSGWPHILSRNRATSSVFIIPDFSYNARRILRKG